MPGNYDFAVCLSHDLDRVYKTYQYGFEAIIERYPLKLLGWLSSDNSYWIFGNITPISVLTDHLKQE